MLVVYRVSTGRSISRLSANDLSGIFTRFDKYCSLILLVMGNSRLSFKQDMHSNLRSTFFFLSDFSSTCTIAVQLHRYKGKLYPIQNGEFLPMNRKSRGQNVTLIEIRRIYRPQDSMCLAWRKLSQKTFWKKDKMLVTNHFSFSHNVFKKLGLVISVHLSSLPVAFGLTHSHTMTPFDAPGKQAF